MQKLNFYNLYYLSQKMENSVYRYAGIGLIFGVAIGSSLDFLQGFTGVPSGIGAGIGIVIGAIVGKYKGKK